MPEKKTYVPKSSAKIVTFRDGGSLMKLSFQVDALIEFLKQHRNERGYINLNVTERKTPSQYGETHSVWLDTWKPRQGPDSDTPATERQQAREERVNRPPDYDPDVGF